MSSNIDHLISPVRDEFAAFEKLLGQVTISERPFMKPITRDVLRGGGKRMRPLLTLLVARLGGQVNDRVMAAAVLIEMIHWSTLVHDDVIDEAYVRRGEWTPGALLRSKSAVLVGDYLFSKGLAYAASAQSFRAIHAATHAIEEIVDGELMQMEHTRLFDTTEQIYTEIIRLKTAVLIAAAAQAGAAESIDSESTGTEPADHVQRMYRFGEMLGLAFQIKDDLLDYGFSTPDRKGITKAETGKILCNDIRERKMTLPLIYALSQASAAERSEAMSRLRNSVDSARHVMWLRDFVSRGGGAEYSTSVMEGYHAKAIALLAPYPQNDITQALRAYADYVLGRDF